LYLKVVLSTHEEEDVSFVGVGAGAGAGAGGLAGVLVSSITTVNVVVSSFLKSLPLNILMLSKNP